MWWLLWPEQILAWASNLSTKMKQSKFESYLQLNSWSTFEFPNSPWSNFKVPNFPWSTFKVPNFPWSTFKLSLIFSGQFLSSLIFPDQPLSSLVFPALQNGVLTLIFSHSKDDRIFSRVDFCILIMISQVGRYENLKNCLDNNSHNLLTFVFFKKCRGNDKIEIVNSKWLYL